MHEIVDQDADQDVTSLIQTTDIFFKEQSNGFLLQMINGTVVQLQGSLSSASLLFIPERCQQKLHSPSKKKKKKADEKYERTYSVHTHIHNTH